MNQSLAAVRAAMRTLHRAAEPEVLAGLLPSATLAPATRDAVVGRALALLASNTVIAKPAPQTPEIARRAVALAHEAGVPADVLALVTGDGDIGDALVRDPRVMGVAFTGSTATARRIARALLDDETRPLVPLIAETGGINAMIVDSTALTEQVLMTMR